MTSESATAVANPPAEPARELQETIIQPPEGWQSLQWAEVWAHRNLIYFLTWRDLKIRYKQTAFGALWAIIQPLLLMVAFAMFFSDTHGKDPSDLPYVLFLYAGLLPWTFVSQAVSKAAMSLVSAERLIEKVYFPRLVVPLSAVLGALFDFAIASAVLGAMMIWYRIPISKEILLLPVAVLLLCILSLGVGVLYASLNITYRDFRHLLTFVMQIWMFATPSLYNPSLYDQQEKQAAESHLSAAANSDEQREVAKPSASMKSPFGPMAGKVASAPENDDTPEAQSATDTAAGNEASVWKKAGRSANKALKELSKYVSVRDLNPLTAIIAFFRAVILGSHLPWMKVAKSAIFSVFILAVALIYFRRVEGRFADII